MKEINMQDIVAFCKNRGFVYPGSDIYGGLSNSWDYGPLGVELKNNIKRAWWQKFIQESEYNVGIDAAILMNPEVWITTGHVSGFSDPLIDCKECKTRHRADKLIEDWINKNKSSISVEGMNDENLMEFIKENKIVCPNCLKTNFTDIRKFNLMFKTFQGITEDTKSEIYLRPETAQGMFINFKNVQRTTRKKMPMGIGMQGKSFRNEITPGNFIFRTREFEQMELEFFCEPGTDLKWYEYWKDFCKNWIINLGVKENNLKLREHNKEELSFYSKGTTDIEYKFPFGYGELWGIANRTDYDLKCHMEKTKEDLTYFDEENKKRYIPYCIEPAVGVDRLLLMFLCDAYEEEITENDTRIVLKIHPCLAPVKIAVLPLSKKLSEEAKKIYLQFIKKYNCEYDEAGSIGKRYRRQDEIGTPYAITIDFDTLEDKSVTIRERDSMKQERIKIKDLDKYFDNRFTI